MYARGGLDKLKYDIFIEIHSYSTPNITSDLLKRGLLNLRQAAFATDNSSRLW